MSIKKKSKELKLPKEKKRAPAQKKRRSRLGKHNMAPFLAPSIIGVTLFFLLPFSIRLLITRLRRNGSGLTIL